MTSLLVLWYDSRAQRWTASQVVSGVLYVFGDVAGLRVVRIESRLNA